MISPDLKITLAAIEAHDPDGWTLNPTRHDYKAFRVWAIARYGRTAWNLYIRHGEC